MKLNHSNTLLYWYLLSEDVCNVMSEPNTPLMCDMIAHSFMSYFEIDKMIGGLPSFTKWTRH
jgi:hypothetical protein